MQERSKPFPLVLAFVATVINIVLVLYVGERAFGPDVYIPTPLNEYAARMQQMDAHYANRPVR